MLRSKKVSAREVMQAHLAQIERVNPKVNAIVTLVADRALADAAKADDEIAKGKPRGPLHGLPVAHKDLIDTAGIRTTRGSPFYRDHVPTKDSAIVAMISAAGAITVGKTNTPEFGAGSQTFNTVFGATKNPYDVSKTCGGSSGGAAGVRHVAHRDGKRHRRIASQSGVVLQHRWIPALTRSSPSRVAHVVAAFRLRSDGTQRRRRRPALQRDRRAGFP